MEYEELSFVAHPGRVFGQDRTSKAQNVQVKKPIDLSKPTKIIGKVLSALPKPILSKRKDQEADENEAAPKKLTSEELLV